ncbi:MAG: hypothetical protein M3450_05570 [Actinomycetota bacterium]|nr:hypothetical protein [Actinomycetota bacterium]
MLPIAPSTYYTAIRYAERLAEVDAVASVGSVGDSYDNSLAESTTGLIKSELLEPRKPWRGLDDVEFALLGYTDWFRPPHLPRDRPDSTRRAGSHPLR